MNIEDLKTDDDLMAGVWIDYYDGARFKIASAETVTYKKAVQRLARKHNPRKIRNDVGLQEKLAMEAMADTILIDFKGVKAGETALKVTRENKMKILAIPELRDWISNQANDMANFQKEGEAEDVADLKSKS